MAVTAGQATTGVRGTYAAGVVWPRPRPAATRVLVCFSYCGGGPAGYRGWLATLPEDVDLALVCLPGRERRMAEPAVRTWDELMREAVTATRAAAGRPYLLFGHSLGAWVAFEVAVRMQAAGTPAQALVVSAANPPSRAAQERHRPPTSATPDVDLLEWMTRSGQLAPQVRADPGLCQLAVDLYRADKRAAESYEFVPGRTVSAPLRRLAGEQDPDVDPADGGWRALAAGGYDERVLPGGHFYTPEIWATLPDQLGL
jgi:surfactin synthase thioesterase subunit